MVVFYLRGVFFRLGGRGGGGDKYVADVPFSTH